MAHTPPTPIRHAPTRWRTRSALRVKPSQRKPGERQAQILVFYLGQRFGDARRHGRIGLASGQLFAAFGAVVVAFG